MFHTDSCRYNLNFPSNPVSVDLYGTAGKWPGAFSENNQWPGAFHTLRFANGSTTTVKTVTSVETFPYRNSTEVYSGLCIPSNSSTVTSTEDETPSPRPSGYPKPFIRGEGNEIMTFFPNASLLKDVGVLALTSVSPPVTVNKIANEFVKQASKRGKKKILIDLSGNGGGDPTVAQNLFRIFFPETDVYAATRFRSNEAVYLIGQAVRRYPNNATNDIRPYIYKGEVKPDLIHGFSSWDDLYGPHEILGVNSSSLSAANVSALSTPDDPINGYGVVPANPSKALFAAEDIVLVCHSYRSNPEASTYLDIDHRWRVCIGLLKLRCTYEAARRAHHRLRWPSQERTDAGCRRYKRSIGAESKRIRGALRRIQRGGGKVTQHIDAASHPRTACAVG